MPALFLGEGLGSPFTLACTAFCHWPGRIYHPLLLGVLTDNPCDQLCGGGCCIGQFPTVRCNGHLGKVAAGRSSSTRGFWWVFVWFRGEWNGARRALACRKFPTNADGVRVCVCVCDLRPVLRPPGTHLPPVLTAHVACYVGDLQGQGEWAHLSSVTSSFSLVWLAPSHVDVGRPRPRSSQNLDVWKGPQLLNFSPYRLKSPENRVAP